MVRVLIADNNESVRRGGGSNAPIRRQVVGDLRRRLEFRHRTLRPSS
jgi:hypothetical protein